MTDLLDSSDRELLSIATLVLETAGYGISNSLWGDTEVLIARRREKVALVSSFFSVDALVAAEPGLVDMLVALEPPRPDLDLYLAMLTSQSSTGSMAGTIYSIAYNLRSVRRIVRVGIDPTAGDVSQALRPLMSLTSIEGSEAFREDPLRLIEAELIKNGVDAELVHSYLQRFSSMTTTPDDDELDEGYRDA